MHIPHAVGSARAPLRRIALAGLLLLAIWAAVLVAFAVLRPDPYAHSWRLVLELMFLGILVSVSDGVTQGFDQLYLIFQNGLQDIILVLLMYPLIVGGYERAVRLGAVGRVIRRVHETARRHSSKVAPFGAVGLCAFVFFPFWSTGALVGSTIGFLLGLSTRVIFTAAFTGHVLSVITCVCFFDVIHDAARGFSQSLAQYLPWAVIAVLLAAALLPRLFDPAPLEPPEQEPAPTDQT